MQFKIKENFIQSLIPWSDGKPASWKEKGCNSWEKQIKKENSRDERQLGRNSYQNGRCGGWKEQHSAHVMMLPGEWLEDAPWVGVHIQPTPCIIGRDSTCRRGKARPPSIEELENKSWSESWVINKASQIWEQYSRLGQIKPVYFLTELNQKHFVSLMTPLLLPLSIL